MRKSHRDAASELQEVGHLRHWHVTLEGPDGIRLSKQFGKSDKDSTVVSCILLRNAAGNYDIQPLGYTFRSRISFFEYPTPENRYARNQLFFISLFRLLKDANMWDIISNRDTFLVVNESNTHIGDRAKEIKARLKALILDAQLVKTRKHKTLTPKALNALRKNRRRAA